MSFLPQNYEAPTGNYMKLLLGKNKIRILSPAIVGNMFWTTDGQQRKPVRRRVTERIDPGELGVDSRSGEREKARHFWAFACWNYAANAVQIAEIVQGSVRDGIQSLCADEDWGDPMGYDIAIGKAGSGLDTTYTVTPSNKSPTAPQILAAYKATPINLEALFVGGDPFAATVAGSGHPPAAPRGPQSPAAPTPAEISRKAAFEALKATLPNATAEVIKAKWLELVKMHFGTRPQAQVTAPEWTQVASELQYTGEDVPPIVNDDIPF